MIPSSSSSNNNGSPTTWPKRMPSFSSTLRTPRLQVHHRIDPVLRLVLRLIVAALVANILRQRYDFQQRFERRKILGRHIVDCTHLKTYRGKWRGVQLDVLLGQRNQTGAAAHHLAALLKISFSRLGRSSREVIARVMRNRYSR